MSLKRTRQNFVRIQFWAPREERDAFEIWCKERNASKNRVLLTMMRERLTGTSDGNSLSLNSISPTVASSRHQLRAQTQDLEHLLMEEVVREADPLFAARLKQMLDRAKDRK